METGSNLTVGSATWSPAGTGGVEAGSNKMAGSSVATRRVSLVRHGVIVSTIAFQCLPFKDRPRFVVTQVITSLVLDNSTGKHVDVER